MKTNGNEVRGKAAAGAAISSLASTAHELRTPLTSVLAALELLQVGDLSPTDTNELLERATAAAHHLDFLVDDILDSAALEVQKLRVHCQPLVALDLLRDLTRLIDLQARARGVVLTIGDADPRLLVHTDARRFLQIGFNLIGNALRFAPRGTAVTIRVEATALAVRFAVIDEGPGVAPPLQNQLFAPFAGTATQDNTGRSTGLGLALCQRLVERLGGRIGFTPGTPRGSIFWFELPRAVAEAMGAL